MMRLIHLLFQILSLLRLVYTNVLNDDKGGSMSNVYYGPLDSVQVVKSDLAVAKSLSGDVLGITLGNPNSLRWRISSLSSTESIHTCHGTLYTYSKTTPAIFHHNASSGVFHGRSDLTSAILLIHCFHDLGVLVHTADGRLSYIDKMTLKITLIRDNVRLLLVTSTQWGLRLLINDTKIVDFGPNATSINLHQVKFDNDTIVSLQGSYVQNSMGLVWLLDPFDKISKVSGFSPNIVLLPELLYSIDGNQLALYQIIDHNVKMAAEFKYPSPINNVTYHQYGLTTVLAIRFDEDRWDLLDLTDFLISGNSKAIRRTRVKSPHFLLFISSDEKLDLVFIALNKDASGSRFRLRDGSLQSPIGYLNPHTVSGPSLLIDKPTPKDVFEEQNRIIHDYYTGSFLSNWLRRCLVHASQLRSFIEQLFVKSGPSTVSRVDPKGLHKFIVSWDDLKQVLVASSAADGSILWETPLKHTVLKDIIIKEDIIIGLFDDSILHINAVNGKILETNKVPFITNIKAISSNEYVLRAKNHTKLTHPALSDLYFIDASNRYVAGSTIQKGQTEAARTWKFTTDNSTILKLSQRQNPTLGGSVGIPLVDKAVLYKYLNPNIAAVWARDSSNKLVLYLLDGITGSLLYTQTHTQEVVDFSSLTATLDDNYLVYSYYIKSPKVELRIAVIDMFDTRKKWQTYSPETSAFGFNSTINQVFSRTYVFPERIVSMALTISQYGITVKSILAVTSSGKFLEIPKQILCGRRAHGKDSTSNLDSYPPYFPVILPKDYKVISGDEILNVDGNGQILVKPTAYESSMIVCWTNHNNQFCTVSQPSLSFDLLSSSFDKLKLVLTIGLLLAAYLITKPFVARRKLNDRWIDR